MVDFEVKVGDYIRVKSPNPNYSGIWQKWNRITYIDNFIDEYSTENGLGFSIFFTKEGINEVKQSKLNKTKIGGIL